MSGTVWFSKPGKEARPKWHFLKPFYFVFQTIAFPKKTKITRWGQVMLGNAIFINK